MIVGDMNNSIQHYNLIVYLDTWSHICFKSETSGGLTLKCQETHEYVLSTVATDALVLKRQAISIHRAG